MPTLADRVQKAVAVIRRTTDLRPAVGVVLGTGLGEHFVRALQPEARIPYRDLPGFVTATVETHPGELIFGTLQDTPLVAMHGRFHHYEGWSMAEVTFPVRVLAGLGIHTLLLSGACGGLRREHRAGDLAILEDHINLLPENPLRGPNDDRLGPRFPDLSEPYTQALVARAEALALAQGTRAHRAVYAAVGGPNLETRAEYRYLQRIGADIVGMSTVPEVLVAVHQGLQICAVSVITDCCIPDALRPADIDEIIRIAGEAEPRVTALFAALIPELKPKEPA